MPCTLKHVVYSQNVMKPYIYVKYKHVKKNEMLKFVHFIDHDAHLEA